MGFSNFNFVVNDLLIHLKYYEPYIYDCNH